MNKKTILVLAIAALVALPVAAMGAVSAPTSPGAFEFTLGGYVKMEADWDSTYTNINMVSPIARSNDPSGQHGRLKMTANNSRFNLTVKGPKVFGAQVTGFLEFDVSANGGQLSGAVGTIDTAAAFRMRHAMFRLNWPETELLLGQYWGFFSEFTPEAAQDGCLQNTGSAVQRMPQIRLTQKFLGTYTLSAMIAAPTNMYDSITQAAFIPWNGIAANANIGAVPNLPGETTETPQVQLKAAYEKDLWGKAAFYGVPRGFVAQVAAAWQRTRYRAGVIAGHSTFGQDQFNLLGIGASGFGGVTGMNTAQWVRNQEYLDPWIVQASLFIPVIPTTTANLAGTASISTQWYIGAGTDFVGEGVASNGSFLMFNNPGMTPANAAVNFYTRQLKKSFGGFIQGQYYFTNQWYMNFVYGMNRAFGVSRDRNAACVTPANPEGYMIALPADMYNLWQSYNLTLWYRPVQALKFGVQYSYARTTYFQITQAGMINVPGTGAAANPAIGLPAVPGGQQRSNFGENHRVMFAGFFYF